MSKMKMASHDRPDISVIVTALNEENNILSAINNTLAAFADYSLKGEIIVVNDGSTDRTGELVMDVVNNDCRVTVLSHIRNQGVGASFWDGVDRARGDALFWLPGDNENDPREILRYLKLMNDVDVVIPFVYNRGVRSFFRNLLSSLYLFMINLTFRANFHYTNGTIIYRRAILQELGYRNRSFFFQTDILVRLIRENYLFAEVPYRLNPKADRRSKSVSPASLLRVAGGYLRLLRDCYFSRDRKDKTDFASGSLTAARRGDRQ